MNYVKLSILIFAILISLNGCCEKNETMTLYINSTLVDCTGIGPQKCLLIKKSMNDEWELFYDSIEGFVYEEGYLYEILVEVREIKNPPADGSSVEYKLIEIVSMTEVI